MSEAAPPTESRGLQNPSVKRKRTPSSATSPASLGVQAKAPKTNNVNSGSSSSSQLQINYIARQCIDDLPFISKDDTLPGMLDVLSNYTQVLDRHESLASNLGARPLGPILIKRFERLFDAPPRVIASHSHSRDQDLPQVTWLDVVHFAQAHPTQFSLSTFSEGRRVCQFYYPQKQVRVQISEEDFLFINSGRCQDLIPPLPIWEDEEKEVATCEIVERALRDLTAAADSVAARTRQLAHRLKGRRMAILERRSAEESHNHEVQQRAAQPAFISVNSQQQQHPQTQHYPTPQPAQSPEKLDPALHIRNDLLKHFQSLPKQPPTQAENRRISSVQQQPQSPTFHTPPPATNNPHLSTDSTSASVSPVPTNVAALAAAATAQANAYRSESPNPNNLPRHNFSKPLPASQEGQQPYRTICNTHMESLPRGSRMLPPCDRCRRLKMDCVKNLSSCQGCTKKHARCHWKEISREEVQGLEGFDDAERAARDFEDRRFSGGGAEYAASDTSVDVDAREAYEYAQSATPAAHMPFQHQQQLQQHNQRAYQDIPQTLGYSHPHQRPYEDTPPQPHSQPESRTPVPPSYPRHSLPEDQHQHQQQLHTPQPAPAPAMDILRLLGSGSGSGSANTDAATAAAAARNNGAFRSAFTGNGDEAAGSGTVTGGPVNGIGVGQEGEGQRV